MTKKIKKMCLFVLAGLCFFTSAENSYAQEKRHITPDEAVALAIQNNLGLESQRITTQTKKRKSDLFWNAFIPSLGISGGLTVDNEKPPSSMSVPVPIPPANIIYGTANIPAEISPVHLMGQIQIQVGLSIALFEGIKAYRLDYQNGLITYDKVKLQLERDIRKAYYGILLLEEQAKLARESLAIAQDSEESARVNYRAGRSPQLQWLQAQVNAKNLQPQVDQATRGVKLAKSQFSMNMGLPLDTELELEPIDDVDSVAALNMGELVKKAIDRKPDILELKAQLNTVKAQRSAQMYSDLTPTLALSWNSQSVFTQITKPAENDISKPDDWNKSGGFTIALSWTPTNFIPWGTSIQALKDTDDSIKKLSIGLSQAIQGVELDIYNSVNTLEQLRITMEAQEATVELAQRSYSETNTAYRNGLQSLLDVENAQVQLNSARVNLQQQKFNYLQGLVDLEYSIGVPFGTFISSQK
ncbi:MAG: TolC family protein [Spirochaetaceae bacterium]|jgi:outer membrane protein TolC|nr:TolC family protein [Spirochaetaceae bacterium]